MEDAIKPSCIWWEQILWLPDCGNGKSILAREKILAYKVNNHEFIPDGEIQMDW